MEDKGEDEEKDEEEGEEEEEEEDEEREEEDNEEEDAAWISVANAFIEHIGLKPDPALVGVLKR